MPNEATILINQGHLEAFKKIKIKRQAISIKVIKNNQRLGKTLKVGE